jgi:hypothetical protein
MILSSSFFATLASSPAQAIPPGMNMTVTAIGNDPNN